MSEKISIDTNYIKLDSFLKLANLVMSGGEAKLLIQDGQVTVNGQIENRRGRKLYPGDQVSVANRPPVWIKGS
ncbi:MAG: S4 domain-containing protein YaaA [Trichlorobacter sp.]